MIGRASRTDFSSKILMVPQNKASNLDRTSLVGSSYIGVIDELCATSKTIGRVSTLDGCCIKYI
jgi:hypothetical protein